MVKSKTHILNTIFYFWSLFYSHSYNWVRPKSRDNKWNLVGIFHSEYKLTWWKWSVSDDLLHQLFDTGGALLLNAQRAGGVQPVRHRQQQVRQVHLRTRKESAQTTSDPSTGELICSLQRQIYHPFSRCFFFLRLFLMYSVTWLYIITWKSYWVKNDNNESDWWCLMIPPGCQSAQEEVLWLKR